MNLSDYMIKTRETATYPEAMREGALGLSYLGLGLGGESGEVQGKIGEWAEMYMLLPMLGLHLGKKSSAAQEKIKKYLRGDFGISELRSQVRKELGDVIWYWVRICDALGIVPEEVLQENLSKLADRKARGVLQGSGDDR